MKSIRNLYFSTLFWATIIALVLLFIAAYVFPILFWFIKLAFVLFCVAVVLDAVLLYRSKEGIFARRDAPDRLSNGDSNPIVIYLQNNYSFKTFLEIVDEIPHQFQKRDVLFEAQLLPNENQQLRYELRPTKRGEYSFGAVNVFVKSPIRLLKRRYRFSDRKSVV